MARGCGRCMACGGALLQENCLIDFLGQQLKQINNKKKIF